jgi:SAM-dependent methyltransferase
MINELVLGCGPNPQKFVLSPLSTSQIFENPTTVDINSEHNPDKAWDLNILPWPFEDDSFDEIHAYNILEHLGSLGDYKSFFAHFEEMWRILKTGGYICGVSVDYDTVHLWGDPGHTRAITRQMLSAFLSREQYELQSGKTSMTDYRFCYNADFEMIPVTGDVIGDKETHADSFAFVLKAFKPIRFPNGGNNE